MFQSLHLSPARTVTEPKTPSKFLKALTSSTEDEDGSRRQSKRQKATQGTRKRQIQQEPTGIPTNRGSPQHRTDFGTPLPSPRRRSERFSHGAGLRAFFEPWSREHQAEDDASHQGMASDGTQGPRPTAQNQGPTSPAGRADEQSQEASSRSTRRRLGEDFNQVSVPHTGGEQQRSPIQLSATEHHHESTGDRSGPTSPHHGTHDQPTHQNPDLAPAALHCHSVRSSPTQRPNTAEPAEGAISQSTGDSMAPFTGHDTSTLGRDALSLAGDDPLRSLAAGAGTDAPSHLTTDSIGNSPGPPAGEHVITEEG